jgi:voltage-gated sodium channel
MQTEQKKDGAPSTCCGSYVERCKNIRDNDTFKSIVIGTIILVSVAIGLETSATLAENYATLFAAANVLASAIFTIEAVIKISAEWPSPIRYFYDRWNCFDFLIVICAFLDIPGLLLIRLLRLLNVLKLASSVPKLQILVGALFEAFPKMGYVFVILFGLWYVYSVIGVLVFRANDPIHFNGLDIAFLTMFRVVTAEDWTDVMYINMYGCANYGYVGNEDRCVASNAYPNFSSFFFVSFVFLGMFIGINLFIGVVMAGMDSARAENEYLQRTMSKGNAAFSNTLAEEVEKMRFKIQSMSDELMNLQILVGGASVPGGKG